MIQNNVLRITTVPARLDFSTVKPYMSTTYIPAKLDIEKTPSRLDMSSRMIKCDIDSSECFAQEGDKTVGRLIADFAQEGIETAQEVAKEATDEGQEVIAAAPHEDINQEIARSKVLGQQKEYGLSFIPSVRPRITWEKNELNINYQPAHNVYNWQVSTRPDSELLRNNSLTVTMTQYPQINFEYTGDNNTLRLLDQKA